MAYEGNRLSTYSNLSNNSRANPSHSAQVSTQTLLNALHTSYSASKPLALESSTSLVVNTWLNAAREDAGRPGGTVDADLAHRAWEHARRRAEDGCIVLGSLHESTPSLFVPFIAALPISIPDIVYTAISAVRPLLTCVTPHNPTAGRHSALAATFTLSLAGTLTATTLKLSTSGINTSTGLLDLPAEQGYRAFDVFYYLLSSASTQAEREALGLRSSSSYTLLRKSGTYDTPSYLPTADDAAAAEEWRDCLKAIGITGSARRNFVSILAALLKLGETVGYSIDEDELEETVEQAAGLLDLDPDVLLRHCSTEERRALVGGIYEALVDWVISKANHAMALELCDQQRGSSSSSDSAAGAMTPTTSEDDDTACLTVLEIPDPQLGKAAALSTIFNDTEGINAEMRQDGVNVPPAGHSVLTEMQAAVSSRETDLGITNGHTGREKELEKDRREAILEKVSHEAEDDSFLRSLLQQAGGHHSFGHSSSRFELMNLIGSSRVWFHLCLHPTDDLPATLASTSAPWSAGSPSRQMRSWRLPEWANRRNKQLDYTADFDLDEFCTRYSRLGCTEGRDGIESFLLERGWSNGEVMIGAERVWIREGSWREAESMLDMLPPDHTPGNMMGDNNGYFGSPFGDHATIQDSRDNLLQRNQSSATFDNRSFGGARSLAPTAAMTMRTASKGDYGLGYKGDELKGAAAYINDLDPELTDPTHVQEQPTTRTRRMWVAFVWALTFWIPSFLLRSIGRMKRPDVRMAWREKVVLVALILLMNAIVVFYIIAFGSILCPNQDKVWNSDQLSTHQGSNDFFVAVRGKVYDISKFAKVSHGTTGAMATEDTMTPYAGLVLDPLFPIPLNVACPTLVTDPNAATLLVNQTAINSNILVSAPQQHISGPLTPYRSTSLKDPYWFQKNFLSTMQQYYKGELVFATKDLKKTGQTSNTPIVYINNNVYDLSDYFYNKETLSDAASASFLAPQVEQMIQMNAGTDITDEWNKFMASNSSGADLNWLCLNNAFYVGKTDFRDTARCEVNNYILLAFTIILCIVILTKFLSALQLSSKKRPAQQDKFVICQVPAYTEGEDHLRKGLDSLTALAYDNKRKLICVICDGMIVGGGNDRPTPKIVLDILGVDPKIDPPALPFKSVGSGSEKLNYGKVYSGLYEFEGNVVPYIVVVKVGKESEQTKAKPGNRGKRDSQIVLMNFLNRVHHRAPMSPLELEMFHQINNIIGVDPELYEYLFMVDADTLVAPDSLNRLVAQCANDAKVAGICGETSLENEERSWTTMIQVYEYYISHHLAKAFESLFGSVTCLPGCFCMYRLRTADKGKPLIISDKVINDYSIQDVDTLHKKNLLSLGEDRYLTTLMTKHFPAMSYKFESGAYAKTAAPESWSVLLSQRRRWINSTIHNLAELVFLKDLCGFCCFSMRFVVFIDLFGTIILPATCAYIVYLVYKVASGKGSLPLVSIIMLAAVYGLQAIIFLIKRQWQHIGWMIIYILAFPIYSLVLPIYSFWKQDDFSWGNTRIVIGEKGHSKIIATEDEGFDPRSIPLQGWDDYAMVNNLPGRRGFANEGSEKAYDDNGYEMDDIRSVYSSIKPASTVLTGFKSGQQFYMAPPSPSPSPYGRPGMQQRQSNFSQFTGRYTDNPSPNGGGGMYSGGGNTPLAMSEHGFPQSNPNPYMNMSRSPAPGYHSTDNLMTSGYPSGAVSNIGSPTPTMPPNRAGRMSPMPFATPLPQSHSRAPSTINLNFQSAINGQGEPSDESIVEAIQACLEAVDLDNVTKKQLKAFTEQRLGCQLGFEKRAFLDRQIDAELANM